MREAKEKRVEDGAWRIREERAECRDNEVDGGRGMMPGAVW